MFGTFSIIGSLVSSLLRKIRTWSSRAFGSRMLGEPSKSGETGFEFASSTIKQCRFLATDSSSPAYSSVQSNNKWLIPIPFNNNNINNAS